jgi:CDP-paratose 2-epimerase
MPDVPVREQQTRYGYSDLQHGVDEAQPLDFHSPYACSKGAADQYVRDYHRIYGISTVVCRQSCIYGPRQYGLESQGWVAWLILSAISGKPLNVYGDGKQVRDLLYIDDLIDCYLALHEAQAQVAGEVFNVGGGPDNLLSILELIGQLESLTGRSLDVHFASWRPADQRVYVSDTRKVCERLGWSPKISPLNGVAKLYAWICDRLEDLEATYAES